MEFFNLPISSKVDKNIPKEIIYKNAEANEKFKRIGCYTEMRAWVSMDWMRNCFPMTAPFLYLESI